MSPKLLPRSVVDIAASVRGGEVSAESITQASLDAVAARDGQLGGFLSVAPDLALQRARDIDLRRERGESLGPLAGVPIALKDALCTKDQPTTSGSKILTQGIDQQGRAIDPWRPPYDATVVARLRAADAVFIGKSNLDEFAMGSSNENSAFRLARNPWNLDRTPGGSSGGSAVAVAGRMTAGALGSDTGGSVRQPAALTGTVGVKPSYGRVSRYGLIAFASSLDQVGPITHDVASSAAMLQIIAGADPADGTTTHHRVGAYREACSRGVAGMRIGVPAEYFAEGLDDEVAAQVRRAIGALEENGASISNIELPHTRHAVATYYILATAECSSNLSRFDGVRFGHRAHGSQTLREVYETTRGGGFGPEVKRRIMLGTYVLSAGYYDAYYRRAQQVRTLIRRDFEHAFQSVDLIATPVSPTVAFPLGSKLDDPLAMYLADVYTLPASLAGIAAISVPCGLGSASGLPVGLQIIAPSFAEEQMFQAAQVVEDTAPDREVIPQACQS
ncbi:MAG: Asp-tRNA(Asn)/Glu-tRNA(Gln) amidotransferase subunit GatA [Polyangiaceae bacterium]